MRGHKAGRAPRPSGTVGEVAWRKAGLVVAALLGATACDPSTRPSRIVEPGWAVRPTDGTPFRRGRSQAVTATVESIHLKDARLSLAAVYRAPDGTETVEPFPAGDDREYLPRGHVQLPFALSLGFRVPDGPPPTAPGLAPGSRAVAMRAYLDAPASAIPAPGWIATYPIVD
jgi:hypothetical protein